METSPDGAGVTGTYNDFDGTGPGTFRGQATAAGYWEAQNGSVSGWFEFRLADDCQSFSGSWQGDPTAPDPYTGKAYPVTGRR